MVISDALYTATIYILIGITIILLWAMAKHLKNKEFIISALCFLTSGTLITFIIGMCQY